MITQNAIYQISGADLMQFAQVIIADTKRELEEAITKQNEDRLYTTEQTCKRMSVDPSTLWRWNKRGYLCPVKVGVKNLYRESDINRIIGGK